MKYSINIGALVLVFIALFISTPVLAGQTKNEVLYDCDKPTDDDLICLACNIYHEARGETSPGLWLVALATKNRVEGSLYPMKNAGPKVKKEEFKSNYCRVVYEQRRDKNTKKWTPMFSWTRDGKHDRVYNTDKWTDALQLAGKVVTTPNAFVDITFGCQWYHHIAISPYWMKDYHPTIRIGAHQCYSLNEQVYLDHLNETVPVIGAHRIQEETVAIAD